MDLSVSFFGFAFLTAHQVSVQLLQRIAKLSKKNSLSMHAVRHIVQTASITISQVNSRI